MNLFVQIYYDEMDLGNNRHAYSTLRAKATFKSSANDAIANQHRQKRFLRHRAPQVAATTLCSSVRRFRGQDHRVVTCKESGAVYVTYIFVYPLRLVCNAAVCSYRRPLLQPPWRLYVQKSAASDDMCWLVEGVVGFSGTVSHTLENQTYHFIEQHCIS